jgi:hypothetical protein
MIGTASSGDRAGLRRLPSDRPEIAMNFTTILLVVLVLMLIGVLPAWPHSAGWGYYPSGVLGAVLTVLLILFVFRRI